MKARIKATGDIVEIIAIDESYLFCSDGAHYGIESLEEIEHEIDYWTRLEHQYAGMAMQGLVTRGEVLGATKQEIAIEIADISDIIAHALIQKLKEKEE